MGKRYEVCLPSFLVSNKSLSVVWSSNFIHSLIPTEEADSGKGKVLGDQSWIIHQPEPHQIEPQTM